MKTSFELFFSKSAANDSMKLNFMFLIQCFSTFSQIDSRDLYI